MRDIGRLNEEARFLQRVETPDGAGGFAVEWVARYARLVAVTKPALSASLEAVAAGAVQSSLAVIIHLRDDPEISTIDERWQVFVQDRRWDIRSISPEVDGMRSMSVEAGKADTPPEERGAPPAVTPPTAVVFGAVLTWGA
ncbi:MAG: head-tail adaptor protein [Pseudomonadota bacterium]